MQCNVGGGDRTIRFIAGVVIMGLGVYFQSWWGALGLVVFLTAVFSRCPLYIPLGISTCPAQKEVPPITTDPAQKN